MIYKTLTTYWNSLKHLFFPATCLACGEALPDGVAHVCLSCQLDLPETDFHLQSDNPFALRFQGRLPVSEAVALFYFTPKGRTQKLIHALKYDGQQEMAFYLGDWLGQKIAQAPHFQDIDALIPVPMHPKKERERGYNQAEIIAKGLSKRLDVPIEADLLLKTVYTISQAQQQLSFAERFENVASVFQAPFITDKTHVLLVDDVMTTGATLEACVAALHANNPNIKISLAVLAYVQPRLT